MKIQLSEKQKSIHARAVDLSLRASEMEFSRIENLIDVEANNVHKAFGKKMFTYATEVLQMDPGLAYLYIAVARACVKFVSLRKALGDKTLSVTKAGRIVSCLSKDNSDELIKFAETHSKREIEDEIAKRNPKAGTRDRVRPLNGEFDELKVRLPKEISRNLARVRALNPTQDLSQTMETLIEFYLTHKDPVRKADRAHKSRNFVKAGNPEATPSVREPKSVELSPLPNLSHRKLINQKFCPGRKRQPLTAEQKHAVHHRDKGCCTFVGIDGRRCGSDRWVEIHHIVPIHNGGTNELENLTTHCSFHHDLVHQLSLPMEGQVNWLR
jgi:hypothetical protein